jgi:hypothetical protein
VDFDCAKHFPAMVPPKTAVADHARLAAEACCRKLRLDAKNLFI